MRLHLIDQIPLENGCLLVRAKVSSLHTHGILLVWGVILTQTTENFHFQLVQDTRLELRRRDAVPIWNRMEQWLTSDAAHRALPSSAIGEALGYLRNQWTALRRYLSDGYIPIDNDRVLPVGACELR